MRGEKEEDWKRKEKREGEDEGGREHGGKRERNYKSQGGKMGGIEGKSGERSPRMGKMVIMVWNCDRK